MLTPNTLLQNRYLVIRPVGRGGMGAVYEATDTRLRCQVALKRTLLVESSMRKAFIQEARLLARLRHPTLPRVSDHFVEGNEQYLVMEFIPGDDLGTLLTRNGGKFPSADVILWVLRWADQLLDALEYLHAQTPPIIHRDIKPQNLKLTSRGDIILLDFGLAKAGTAQMSTVTAAGKTGIMGYTPNYAPLEQIRGTDPDPRSDLYALGATLYHLLTGVKPPDALTRAAALLNNQADTLRPANELNPQISPALAGVLQSALALSPESRPPTAALMRRALRGVRAAPSLVQNLSIIESSENPTVLALPASGVNSLVPSSAPFVTAVPPPQQPITQPPAGNLLRATATGSPILCIALSPDGYTLAAGSDDGSIGLWDLKEGTLQRPLMGHTRSIQSISFSPDGQVLAAGCEDKTARMWRVSDGSSLPMPDLRTYPAECVAFSPDGQTLATGGWGHAVCLWRVDAANRVNEQDKELSRRAILTTSFALSLAFSPDGQMLAVGCYDGTVRIWRLSDGMLLRTLEVHNNFVLSVAFSPDGQQIATGGGSSAVYLWRTGDGRLLDTLRGHVNNVRSVAFSPNGQILATGSEDKSVRLWRASDGAPLHMFAEHSGGVTSLAFSLDGQILISGSRDTKIRLWQVA